MADEIIKELWEIKDSIAQEFNYDVEALVDHLRSVRAKSGRTVVDLRSIKDKDEQGADTEADKPRS